VARTVSIVDEELMRARQLRDQAATPRELRMALSVLLVAEAGLEARQVAEILGISERTLFRNREAVRSGESLQSRCWGGRRHCSMTIQEEREFLNQWTALAARGGVLSVPPIHAALVEKLGRPMPLSTTYRLLARHGWRKVQPDTKHPKSDPAARKEFKKTSRDGGNRLLEESPGVALALDVSRRGAFWAHERPAGLLGAGAVAARGESGAGSRIQV